MTLTGAGVTAGPAEFRSAGPRALTAVNGTRRRLERNLHDGAQQDLVALAIKAQLADVTVDEDPAQAKQIIGEIKADAAGALENLRDLARGIYPPLLADLGLAAALGAQASKSPVPVVIEAGRIGRFPQDTEAAVYFCCLEALQNTAKYAHATQARICLQAQDGSLRFTVSDDGAGYDARHTRWGRACATWPTGSPRSAAGSRYGPLPVRAPPSPGSYRSRPPSAIISARQSPIAKTAPSRRQIVGAKTQPATPRKRSSPDTALLITSSRMFTPAAFTGKPS
jgi:hypothetical protein